jgi:glucosamine-6-phosphate deaminase
LVNLLTQKQVLFINAIIEGVDMLVIIKDDYESICQEAARHVADLIEKKPNCVLGLATGSTPLGVYRELIRLHKEGGLDFSQITTFNLDEYVGLPKTHEQSYYFFMQENLFKHININPNSIHIPNGMAEDIEEECLFYEEQIVKAGGIDLQILGIGANGHIAFNEPLSSLGSRTRIKTLTHKTRQDNARFFSSIDEVPKYAITMGVGSIMESRSIILLASGKNKAEAISKTIEGPITAMVPATMVQMHRDAVILVDQDAASLLSREWI